MTPQDLTPPTADQPGSEEPRTSSPPEVSSRGKEGPCPQQVGGAFKSVLFERGMTPHDPAPPEAVQPDLKKPRTSSLPAVGVEAPAVGVEALFATTGRWGLCKQTT